MGETLAQRLEEGISQIFLFLPQLLAALGILLAGYAIAKMVERGTDAAMHRIGFDRWMREGGVTEALERAGTRLDPSTVLAKLVFWIVMLLVILMAANALGLSVVSALFYELLTYIPNVIAAVIVLVLGLLLGEFVKDLILASAGVMHGVPTLARAAKGAVIVLAIFMALEQLNIAEDIVLVAFIAVVGAGSLAAGIAFGLGGKDIAAEIAREWYDRSRLLAAENAAQAAARGESPPYGAPRTPHGHGTSHAAPQAPPAPAATRTPSGAPSEDAAPGDLFDAEHGPGKPGDRRE